MHSVTEMLRAQIISLQAELKTCTNENKILEIKKLIEENKDLLEKKYNELLEHNGETLGEFELRVDSKPKSIKRATGIKLLDEHFGGGFEEGMFINLIGESGAGKSTLMLEMLMNITDVLKYFLAGIAAISLVVGGIGIMNIMLISVNQRIREVGLRKAVGARRRHIIMQFLVEAIFITLIGGIIGIILGIFISLLTSVVINALGYEWQFIISLNSIFVATSVSVLIGVIFGLYPARKAAKISPMEALRYE